MYLWNIKPFFLLCFPLSASGARGKNRYTLTAATWLHLRSLCYMNSWSWSSGRREASSPSSVLLVILALWTRRTNACTTSDIGGLNSGSGWNSSGVGSYNSDDQYMHVRLVRTNCILKFIPGHTARRHQRNGRVIWQGKDPWELDQPSDPVHRCRAAGGLPTGQGTAQTGF
jgi:hypothetical protein